MFDSAYVDTTATFPTLMFLSAQKKDEYISKEERDAGKTGGQKLNKDGVPMWKVELVATNWRGRSSTLTISVPHPVNPGEALEAMTPVRLVGLQFGQTRQKVAYWTAEGIEALKPASAAASA